MKKEEKASRVKKAAYPLSLILTAGLCAYVLVPGFKQLDRVHVQIDELRRTESEKRLYNEALKQEIGSMYTSEGIERAARRHLRLARPDEVIVVFESPQENKSAE
jgi:cell division protein FtsB